MASDILDNVLPASDRNETVLAREMFTNFTNETDDGCEFRMDPNAPDRFYLVTVFGSLMALIGFFNNCLLIHVLIRSSLIKTNVFYLCVLALCDIICALSYILLFSTQCLYLYSGSAALKSVWHKYVIWVFGTTHVGLTLSAYMIVAASGERFLSTLKCLKHRTIDSRDRICVTAAIFCFALLSKGTVFWELEVVIDENCTGYGRYDIARSDFAQDPVYEVAYSLWFRHVTHVFVPFFMLLTLNGLILLHLKRNPMEMHSALISLTLGDLARQRKKSIRAATLMLAAIVTTYLISNLLNVVISIWEHIDKEFLFSQPNFYTFSTDVISLLTVVTGCIRLPIYCTVNKQLRKEVRTVVDSWRNGGRMIRHSCKRFFIKARENNNDTNFMNLCDYSTGVEYYTNESQTPRLLNGTGSAEEREALLIDSDGRKLTIMSMTPSELV